MIHVHRCSKNKINNNDITGNLTKFIDIKNTFPYYVEVFEFLLSIEELMYFP
jgi:hypothetical protein